MNQIFNNFYIIQVIRVIYTLSSIYFVLRLLDLEPNNRRRTFYYLAVYLLLEFKDIFTVILAFDDAINKNNYNYNQKTLSISNNYSLSCN